MSTRLERILERDLARSGRAFDNARVTYTMLRNGLLGLGLSSAVFLPLAGSDPSKPEAPPPVQPPEIRQTYNDYHYYPSEGGGPTGGGTPAEPPNIHIDVVSQNIQGAPPMNRDWHRTTFSRDGDEFWALPDASFIMRFTRAEGWSPDCLQEGCNGVFSFASQRYLGTPAPIERAWEVKGREIERDDESEGLNVCSTLGEPIDDVSVVHTKVEYCEFNARVRTEALMEETSGRPDLCIWMRRSDHLEQPGGENGTVALDVRWARRDHNKESCPELYPGIRRTTNGDEPDE